MLLDSRHVVTSKATPRLRTAVSFAKRQENSGLITLRDHVGHETCQRALLQTLQEVDRMSPSDLNISRVTLKRARAGEGTRLKG